MVQHGTAVPPGGSWKHYALNALKNAGLTETTPGYGTFVVSH